MDDIIPCSYKRVIRKESSSISTPASILSPPKSEELSKSILFGKLHLYRQYKSHDSQLIENAILRKTHMLLVLNVPKSYE